MSFYYTRIQTARLYNSLVAQAEKLTGEIYELRRAIWNERLKIQQKLCRISRLRKIIASTPKGSIALQQLIKEYTALEDEYRREDAILRQMEERHRQLEQQLINIMERIKSMRALMGGAISGA